MGDCRSCAFWDQRYPENKGLGVCSRINAFMWPQNEHWGNHIALSPTIGHASCNPPTRAPEDLEVRTVADFGCVQFEKRSQP